VFEEALGLVVIILRHALLLLDPVVFGTLAAAEEYTPDENSNVSHNHTDKAGSDSNHNTNQDWNKDVEDGTSEESGEASMSVVVTVTTVSSVFWTSVSMVHWLDGTVLWALPTTSLQFRNLIRNNCSPFADCGCAFLVVIGGFRRWGLRRYDLGVSNHQLAALCLE